MKRPWIRWLNLAGVGTAFVLMAVFLGRNADALRDVDWVGMSTSLIPSLLLYGTSLGLQAVVWIAIVSGLMKQPWGIWDVVVYLETHLIRRVPGLPWYMAGRAAVYRDRGDHGGSAALTASALEWLGTLATSAIWAVAGYFGVGWATVPAALIPVIFLLVLRWRHSERFPARLRYLRNLEVRPAIVALLVYICIWGLAGFIVYTTVQVVAPELRLGFRFVAGVWSLSAMVSMLTVFAPAGLGVRELSMVAQLAPTLGVARSTVVALVIRVLFTVGDVFYYGCAVLYRSLTRRNTE